MLCARRADSALPRRCPGPAEWRGGWSLFSVRIRYPRLVLVGIGDRSGRNCPPLRSTRNLDATRWKARLAADEEFAKLAGGSMGQAENKLSGYSAFR